MDRIEKKLHSNGNNSICTGSSDKDSERDIPSVHEKEQYAQNSKSHQKDQCEPKWFHQYIPGFVRKNSVTKEKEEDKKVTEEWPMGPLLEFPLHWMFAYTFSLPVVGFAGALALAMAFDYSILEKRQLLDGWCNISAKPLGSFLSLTNALELSLSANIMWRFCITLTAMPRIAIAICYRSLFTQNDVVKENVEPEKTSLMYSFLAATIPFMHTLEVLALSTMSIVTAGDSYELHVIAFWVFFITGLLYMLQIILFFVVSGMKQELPDGDRSFMVKCVSGGLFVTCLYVFIKGQYEFWETTPCSPYVSPVMALTEYLLMASYFVFHASAYWDIFKNSEVVVEAIQEVKDRFRLQQEIKDNSA